jgi:intracellular septation protein A
MAGNMAAKLFAAQTWVTVVCCVVLAADCQGQKATVTQYPWAQAAMLFVVGGLLLALLNQFGVAPRIMARQDLAPVAQRG